MVRIITTNTNTYLTIFSEDHKTIENFQMFIIAGCVSNDTIIKTCKGNIKIADILCNSPFNLLSYNLKDNKLEKDSAIRVNSGIKEVYEIETSNGHKIKATKNHIFFVESKGRIIEKKLEELKIDDNILGNFLEIKKHV